MLQPSRDILEEVTHCLLQLRNTVRRSVDNRSVVVLGWEHHVVLLLIAIKCIRTYSFHLIACRVLVEESGVAAATCRVAAATAAVVIVIGRQFR